MTDETKAITVDVSNIKVGDYVMLTFKPEAKLKDAEGEVLTGDANHEALYMKHHGKERKIDLWKIAEVVVVDNPTLKKAKDALEKSGPLDGVMVMKGTEHVSTATTVLKVDPKEIFVQEGFNPRDKLTDLKELEASMKANGFLQEFAITCKRVVRMVDGQPVEGLEVIAGHRRRQAAINAGCDVFVILKDHRELTEADSLVTAMLENDGVALSLMERARAIKRLVDSGLKRPDVAKRLGKPVAYVTNHMRLLEAPQAVLDAAESKKVPNWFIMQTIRQHHGDPEAQVQRIAEAARSIDDRKKLRIREKTAKRQEREKNKEEKAQKKALLAKTMTRQRAVAKLVQVSDAFMAFKRSRRGAEPSNPAWVQLQEALASVQRLKKTGKLKLSV